MKNKKQTPTGPGEPQRAPQEVVQAGQYASLLPFSCKLYSQQHLVHVVLVPLCCTIVIYPQQKYAHTSISSNVASIYSFVIFCHSSQLYLYLYFPLLLQLKPITLLQIHPLEVPICLLKNSLHRGTSGFLLFVLLSKTGLIGKKGGGMPTLMASGLLDSWSCILKSSHYCWWLGRMT